MIIIKDDDHDDDDYYYFLTLGRPTPFPRKPKN